MDYKPHRLYTQRTRSIFKRKTTLWGINYLDHTRVAYGQISDGTKLLQNILQRQKQKVNNGNETKS